MESDLSGKDSSEDSGALPVWSDGGAQLVLLLAGVMAWTAAIGLAVNDKSGATASLFVSAGTALIAAAAFFSRIRGFGIGRLDIAPGRKVRRVRKALPRPSPGATPEAEREHVFDAIERTLEDTVEAGVRSYERSAEIEALVQDWFDRRRHGTRFGGRGIGVDFVVVPEDGAVAAVDLRHGQEAPTPERLRPGFLHSRQWVDQALGEDRGFHRYLATDSDVPEPLLERYKTLGIGVLQVDLDRMEIDELLPPEDAREPPPP